MDLKTADIRKAYFKYLFPSLFSGLVMSMYSLVDMVVVGQYEGSFILICIVTAMVWGAIFFFDKPLLRICGANDAIMPLALRYMKWLKLGLPLWPLGYFLAMFVRNDGSPTVWRRFYMARYALRRMYNNTSCAMAAAQKDRCRVVRYPVCGLSYFFSFLLLTLPLRDGL